MVGQFSIIMKKVLVIIVIILSKYKSYSTFDLFRAIIKTRKLMIDPLFFISYKRLIT